jgi:hypothetical protein
MKCVDIGRSSQQAFPYDNNGYNPNGRQKKNKRLNDEKEQRHDLKQAQEPDSSDRQPADARSADEYTCLIESLIINILLDIVMREASGACTSAPHFFQAAISGVLHLLGFQREFRRPEIGCRVKWLG